MKSNTISEFTCKCEKTKGWIGVGIQSTPCPECGRKYKGVYNNQTFTIDAIEIKCHNVIIPDNLRYWLWRIQRDFPIKFFYVEMSASISPDCISEHVKITGYQLKVFKWHKLFFGRSEHWKDGKIIDVR